MNEVESKKAKIFPIIIFLLTGLALLYLGYNQKDNISNFSTGDKKVTVIDISEKNNGPNKIPVALGIVFISMGLILAGKTYFSNPKPAIDINSKLSTQEKRIVSLIKEGKTNKEIAIDLSISPSTVKTHINNIYKKLDINSREELLQMC